MDNPAPIQLPSLKEWDPALSSASSGQQTGPSPAQQARDSPQPAPTGSQQQQHPNGQDQQQQQQDSVAHYPYQLGNAPQAAYPAYPPYSLPTLVSASSPAGGGSGAPVGAAYRPSPPPQAYSQYGYPGIRPLPTLSTGPGAASGGPPGAPPYSANRYPPPPPPGQQQRMGGPGYPSYGGARADEEWGTGVASSSSSAAGGIKREREWEDDIQAGGGEGSQDGGDGEKKKKPKVVRQTLEELAGGPAPGAKVPVKKFTCPHASCGRAFARNFNLQSHIKSHLGVRDFNCPECPKSFSRRHDCARHCIAVHRYDKETGKPRTDTANG